MQVLMNRRLKNLPPESFNFQVLKSKVHDNIVDTRHIDVTNKHDCNLEATQFVQAISFLHIRLMQSKGVIV
jgi:hypothetical protein